MALADRFLKRDKINFETLDNIDDRIMRNIRRGRLVGVARSIIIDYVENFTLFNEFNEFDLKMGKPDIRHYEGDNVYCPDDIRYVATFSENENTTRFIQVFYPYKSIYTILDHILGGEGIGEYDRELSLIEKNLLDWYFNFYNDYKTATHSLNYESNVDMTTTFPIKTLFRGLNIIVAYVPLLFKDNPITEIIIRTNLDILNDIVESSRDSQSETTGKKQGESFSIRKMSTDDELEDIVNSIINK